MDKDLTGILLVEDDESHKELILRSFEQADCYKVITADKISESRRHIAAENSLSLVISDWRLPDGEGIDLVEDCEKAKLPLILMTGFGNEEMAVRSLKAGVLDYLVKTPLSFKNMADTVTRALREWEHIQARLAAEERLKRSERLYRLAIDGANDIIWEWHKKMGTIALSPKWMNMTHGFSEDSIMGFEEFLEYLHPEDRFQTAAKFSSTAKNTLSNLKIEFRVRDISGKYRWLLGRGKIMLDEESGVVMAGSFTDITDRKTAERRMHELAYYDKITGLPNREMLNEHCSELAVQSDSGKWAILIIDIDNFKMINDTFGYIFGDMILSEAAGRLFPLVEAGHAFASRFAGDTFVVVVNEYNDVSELKEMLAKIFGSFHAPFDINNSSISLDISCGIAYSPNHGKNLKELMRNAEAAMNEAKKKGRGGYEFFSDTLGSVYRKRLNIERHLRLSLSGFDFQLYYQDIVDTSTLKVQGMEALLRWNNASIGDISPAEFIPVAEETGLIIPIGYWIIKNVLDHLQIMRSQGYEGYITVNVSAVQMMQNDFVERLLAYLNEYALHEQGIAIEITETAMLSRHENYIEKLEKLRAKGVLTLLDDFGSGYSSLSYLKNLPVDIVKIDREFINDICVDRKSADLTAAIINIAHSLNKKVIAEGVETEDQFALLRWFGCDMVQGYLTGRPKPADQCWPRQEIGEV